MKGLLPHHQRLLDQSAISPEVADARGYFSATERADLERLGFRRLQVRVPALVLPVHSVEGQIRLHQIRPDSPRTKKKDGKAIKYETVAGRKMVIDVPPATRAAIGDPARDLWITEGIRKVDALVSQDLAAIGLLGVWNWRGTNNMGGKVAVADFENVALNGRSIFLCFDSDAWGNENVAKALVRLAALLKSRGASIRIVHLPDGPEGQKWGADDYLAAGHSVDELIALAQDEVPVLEDDEKTSKSTRLLRNVEGELDLFHSKDSTAYVSFSVSGHHETWPIHSRRFKSWLRRRFHEVERNAIDGNALTEVIGVLEARAAFDGSEHEVFIRTATLDGRAYLNLCDPEWRSVELSASGWRVVSSAKTPVRFRRAPGMVALPEPETGGDLSLLRGLLRLESSDYENKWRLVLAWLVAALFNDIPLAVLCFYGEQGSGKSVRARILRFFTDPHEAPLRSPPANQRDLVISAKNSWCLVFDNLSRIPPWFSDALCRLSTGGGSAYRRLYTDDEEAIFSVRRPVLLTGIEEVVERGDLLDRSLIIDLPQLPEKERRSERELEEQLQRDAGKIFGALLDAAAGVMAHESNVEISEQVRMADFAVRGTALERALDWEGGAFLRAYRENRADSIALPLEASVIGAVLVAFIESGGCQKASWTELLDELNAHELATDERKRNHSWPKSARGLSGQVRRLAPSLRALEFVFEDGRDGRKRWVTLRPAPQHRHDRHTDTREPNSQEPSDGCAGGDSGTAGSHGDEGDARSDGWAHDRSARNRGLSDDDDGCDDAAGACKGDDEFEEVF